MSHLKTAYDYGFQLALNEMAKLAEGQDSLYHPQSYAEIGDSSRYDIDEGLLDAARLYAGRQAQAVSPALQREGFGQGWAQDRGFTPDPAAAGALPASTRWPSPNEMYGAFDNRFIASPRTGGTQDRPAVNQIYDTATAQSRPDSPGPRVEMGGASNIQAEYRGGTPEARRDIAASSADDPYRKKAKK